MPGKHKKKRTKRKQRHKHIKEEKNSGNLNENMNSRNGFINENNSGQSSSLLDTNSEENLVSALDSSLNIEFGHLFDSQFETSIQENKSGLLNNSIDCTLRGESSYDMCKCETPKNKSIPEQTSFNDIVPRNKSMNRTFSKRYIKEIEADNQSDVTEITETPKRFKNLSSIFANEDQNVSSTTNCDSIEVENKLLGSNNSAKISNLEINPVIFDNDINMIPIIDSSVHIENEVEHKLKIDQVCESLTKIHTQAKTPGKRLRNSSLQNDSVSPTLLHSAKRTKSSPEFLIKHDNLTVVNMAKNFKENSESVSNNITAGFTTNQFFANQVSTPKNRIIQSFHVSTPKSTRSYHKSSKMECKSNYSLEIHKKMSPLLLKADSKKIKMYVDRLSLSKPKAQTKWSCSITGLYSWLGMRIQKGFASIRKLYTSQKANYVLSPKVPLLETKPNSSCHCELYKIQMDSQNDAIKKLQTTVSTLVNKIDEFSEKISHLESQISKGVNIVCAPPPIPPPPPPPPPPLPPLITVSHTTTPNSRVFKTATRKLDKPNISTDNRPTITLDDILKVKLRKTTAHTPSEKKVPSTFHPELLLKQNKLRRSIRAISPSQKAHASLVNILQEVDTRVLTNNRHKSSILIPNGSSQNNIL